MPQTSKEMFKSIGDRLETTRKELNQGKEELENLENQLKVESKILAVFKEKKDVLVEIQEPIVMAVQGEIMIQKDKINELETDIKLFAKKCEVLQRNTWDF